jgi:hypothetical protein
MMKDMRSDAQVNLAEVEESSFFAVVSKSKSLLLDWKLVPSFSS